MRVIPRGDIDNKQGVWEAVRTPKALVAMMSCPECGKTSVLSGHEIAEDGNVTPSVVCPHACKFHEYVQLEGWADMLRAIKEKEKGK